MADGSDAADEPGADGPDDDATRQDAPTRDHQHATPLAAEVLAGVDGAAELLQSKLRRIEELEARLGELDQVTPHRLEALRQQVIVAEVRAEEQDEAARDAEELLRRVHDQIVRQFAQE